MFRARGISLWVEVRKSSDLGNKMLNIQTCGENKLFGAENIFPIFNPTFCKKKLKFTTCESIFRAGL